MQPFVSWTAPYESATASKLLSYIMINEVCQNNSVVNKRNRERKWTAVPASSGLFFFQHSLSQPICFQSWKQMLFEWPCSDTANCLQL